MAAASLRKGNARLPPEVNRAIFVRNLPFNISSEEIHDIFGKYGAIRQIRLGNGKDTRQERLRRLRGHLRRQERRRPPLRLQRRQPLPHRALLSAQQDSQEYGHQEEGARDHQAPGDLRDQLQVVPVRRSEE
uniref:Uncharacterized protein n=1 Tax=Avena sativa TaxID=4498 RepID=A0ACD5Z8S8_AVESA